MNKEQVRLALKAGTKAGLSLNMVERFSGELGIDKRCGKAGDTTKFNPWTDLHDAMLIALACCDGATWDDDFFTIYPKGSVNDKDMKLGRISGVDDSTRIYNIGNAIVNAANT